MTEQASTESPVSASAPAESVPASTETAASAAAATPPDDVARVAALAAAKKAILAEIRQRIVGQDEAVELLMVALFARGHGLLVGVPGLAKTALVTNLARALSLTSNRIQFTPDLMPTDITGTDVLEQDAATGQRSFRFVPGPIFANILLADEINRTPPKTQAALLQAMEERHVTAGGRTHQIEAPYMVFATQNPIEQEGTYALPEAQLDRFMLQINMGYPSAEDEAEIVRRTTAPSQPDPKAILSREEILKLQQLVRRVPVAPHVIDYAVRLVRATRPAESDSPEAVRRFLSFGAGPRASQSLILGAKARAVLDGRFAAEVSDVKRLARPVLRHRLVLNFRAEAEGTSPDALVDAALQAADG